MPTKADLFNLRYSVGKGAILTNIEPRVETTRERLERALGVLAQLDQARAQQARERARVERLTTLAVIPVAIALVLWAMDAPGNQPLGIVVRYLSMLAGAVGIVLGVGMVVYGGIGLWRRLSTENTKGDHE